MVGTFYRRPNPDAEPYVDVGGAVGPDSVVCIVEAMKVNNEIKAEIEHYEIGEKPDRLQEVEDHHRLKHVELEVAGGAAEVDQRHRRLRWARRRDGGSSPRGDRERREGHRRAAGRGQGAGQPVPVLLRCDRDGARSEPW